tara:strand:- start:630 stop:1424 length:795 start_codon:yes stop_codon:yes gene_type:complete
MSNNIQIAIAGANGKMGTLLTELIKSKDGYEISDTTKKINEHTYSNKLNGDYLFIFVPADKINAIIKKGKIHSNGDGDWSNIKKGVIVGSSGIVNTYFDMLKRYSKDENKLVCVVPNFSIGAMYQKLVSRKIQKDFENIKIVEKHHSNKIDSPSGTAIDLASSLAKRNIKNDSDRTYMDDRHTPSFTQWPKKIMFNNIPIDSIRSDEFMAEQIVMFKNQYEEFNTEHIVTDRKAYLTGMNLVLDKLESLNGYYHGLEKILNKRA